MNRICLFAAASILLALGCSQSTGPSTPVQSADAASASKYFLREEPAEPKSVLDAKATAKDGEEITLIGRIGGSDSPFVADRVSFTIVDTSFVPCSEREGDSCPTPWDYCCDTPRLPAGTAVVKLVDESGKTLTKDAKRDLGMKELQTVIVKGTAKKDDAGNLTVLAPALFVRK